RVTVEGAPATAVLRGTQVPLHVTVTDLTAVSIAGATRNQDGSFALVVDTHRAPPGTDVYDVPIAVIDQVGNTTTAHASIPLTRVKYIAQHPTNRSITALVLTDSTVYALADHSAFWFVNRSDGSTTATPSTGGTALDEIATDGSRLFFALTDMRVCRMDSAGASVCGSVGFTLSGGPILQDKAA